MDPTKKIEYRKLLLSLVPESGENIGNVTLREKLKAKLKSLGDELTDEDYWLLRDSLIDEALLEQGRGRGGSVHRVRTIATTQAALDASVGPAHAAAIGEALVPEIAAKAEAELYEPFHLAIINGYTRDNRIKRFISEVTAQQGRRVTGGKWTRPDLGSPTRRR